MFGFGRGGGFGRGRGGGGRGYGPGRGACLDYYQAYGQWPAWSRMAGGPGYWRSAAADVPPYGVPNNEVAELRAEVTQLREQIELALSKLAA